MKQFTCLLAFLCISILLVGCCKDVRPQPEPEKIPFGVQGENESGGQGATLGVKVVEKEGAPVPAAPTGVPCCDALEKKLNDLILKHQQDIAMLQQRPAPAPSYVTAAPGGLRIEHSGPQFASANSALPFNLKVINPFNYPVYNVRLWAYLGEGLEFVSASDGGQYNPQTRAIEWFFPKLDANGSKAVTYEARVGGTGTYEVCAYATFELRECIIVKVVQPNLVCEVTAPPQGMVGRPFEVCVVIRNTGDGPAENATATVRLPVGFQFEDNTNEKVWQGGTVPAGGSIRQCWRVTATSATRGSIDVTVQGAGGLSTSCGSAVEVTMPDLAITKSAPKRAHMGREFEYSIEVKNTGSSDATNVQLVDQLPEGVEFKSASENGSYNGGSRSISWNLGTLRPSESRNFNIVVKAMRENLDPGWRNVARVTCAEGITREAEAYTIVEAVPAMHIDSYDTEDPVQVGDTTTYVITTRNEGQKESTQVQMRVKLPDQTTYVAHDAATGPEAGNMKINGTYDAAGRVVIFDPIPVMKPGDSATFKVTIRAEGVGDECSTAILTFAEFTREITVQEPTKYYK